jgi:hypothetical protein
MIYITKFHDGQFRHLSNIMVITATVWGAVMLVLLIEGIYERLRRPMEKVYQPKWVEKMLHLAQGK